MRRSWERTKTLHTQHNLRTNSELVKRKIFVVNLPICFSFSVFFFFYFHQQGVNCNLACVVVWIGKEVAKLF